MKKKIVFFLPFKSHGAIKFFNLAKDLNDNFSDFIKVLILTPSKELANDAQLSKLGYIYYNPVYKYLENNRFINRFIITRFIRDLFLFAVYKIELKRLIKRIKPAWLVLDSDVGYDESVVLANMGIDSLIVQYTMDATKASDLVEYMEKKGKERNFSFFERLINKLIRTAPDYNRRFANLKGPYNGSPLQHFILKIHKLLPFIDRKGGGRSKYVALNAEPYIDVFAEYGIPRSKLKATGNPENDVLHRTLQNKKEVTQKVMDYFHVKNRKLVCLFLTTLDTFKDYVNYDYNTTNEIILKDLLRFKDEIHVIIKSHPKRDKSLYKYLEKEYNCTVIGEETGFSNDEIMVASEFIMSMGSGVGLLAYGLEIPIITYNFGINSPSTFLRTGGSIHCTTPEEFTNAVDQLLSTDDNYRNQAIEKGKLAAKKFMRVDGKCAERIFNLLNK